LAIAKLVEVMAIAPFLFLKMFFDSRWHC
jgi:hypothetical protein